MKKMTLGDDEKNKIKIDKIEIAIFLLSLLFFALAIMISLFGFMFLDKVAEILYNGIGAPDNLALATQLVGRVSFSSFILSVIIFGLGMFRVIRKMQLTRR